MTDPRLLDAYLSELRYMQALGGEFAQTHPKIAKRLGMLGTQVADPFVNRLLLSAAFVNAQAQLRFDDEIPLQTQALLSSSYPNYFAPTPSIAVARFYPGGQARGFAAGYTVERGTAMTTLELAAGEKTSRTFVTTQDVPVFPLEVADARLTTDATPRFNSSPHGIDRDLNQNNQGAVPDVQSSARPHAHGVV